MPDIETGDILTEIRESRKEQAAAVERVHSRVTDLVVKVGHLESKLTTRPCKEHDARMDEMNERVTGLELNQKKALIGFGVASMGVAAIMSGVWTWLKTKFVW